MAPLSSARDILRTLDRRPLVEVARTECPVRRRLPRVTLRTAGPLRLLTAFGRLAIALLVYARGWLRDRLARRTGPAARATRLREAIASMGPAAQAVGRQLAMRIDIFPIEYSEALARLTDEGPPIPLEYAIARIEQVARRPMDEIFEIFDPEPIAAMAFSSAYQAVLRTGEKVVVQVRAPDIDREVDACIRTFSAFTHLLEFLIVEPETFQGLRRDLPEMMVAELDFAERGRRQSLFRKLARKDGLDFARSTRVHRELTSNEVIFSDFGGGFYLVELVEAVETGDEERLAEFAARDIDPEIIGQRLLDVFWWSLLEAPILYTSFHLSNVLVQPGNRIVFLDFASSSTVSRHLQRVMVEVLTALSEGRVSQAVQFMIQSLLPLPRIDVDEMIKRVEALVWHDYYRMIDDASPPWQRTAAGAWLSLLDIVRELKVQANLEVLAAVHTSLLYYSTIATLWKGIDRKAFRRYQRKAFCRGVRRFERSLERDVPPTPPLQRVSEAVESLRETTFWIEGWLQRVPITFRGTAGKWPFTIVTQLQLATNLAVILLGGLAVVVLYGTWRYGSVTLGEIQEVFAYSLPFQGLLVATILFALRKTVLRLEDKDPDA